MTRAALTYGRAIEAMRRPGTRLVQMHGGPDWGYYIVPGGRVEDSIATKIMAHPLVRASHDGLFPDISQTWRMISDSRPGGAS